MARKGSGSQWQIDHDDNRSDDSFLDGDDLDPVDEFRKDTVRSTNAFDVDFARLSNEISNGIYAFSQKV
ncbi:hypothetical protein SARC_15698, partial [Sphaeroforma arctica JP610]